MIEFDEMHISTIYNEILSYDVKSLCITSACKKSGVSSLAISLVRSASIFGKRSLLLGDSSKRLYSETRIRESKGVLSFSDQFLDEHIEHSEDRTYALLNLVEFSSSITNSRIEIFNLIKILNRRYDLIIIDANSLDTDIKYVTSPELLCEVSQATLLMVLSGVVTASKLRDASVKIARSGANLIGCIMNDYFSPRLVDELCRETHRLDRFALQRMSALRSWFKCNQLLNIDML